MAIKVLLNGWVIMIRLTRVLITKALTKYRAKVSIMFGTSWPGFHEFSRGPSLISFFSGSPTSGWTGNFRLDYIELPWVSLKIKNLILKIHSWVCWARDMLASFTTACCDIEFYASEICCRVLRPRVVILSFMTNSYVVEFYDRML